MPFGMGTSGEDWKLYGGGQETWTGMGGTGGAGGKGPGEWDAYGNWISSLPGGGAGHANPYANQFQAYENPNSIQNRERMRLMQLADERSQFTGDYLDRLRSGEDSAAQQQMQMGLGQAQRAMQQAAVARGSNPLAQRAAVYGGGQMAQQGVTQSAMLRAQEIQGGMGLHSAAMRDRTAAEQFVQANRGQLAIQQQGIAMQNEAMQNAYADGDADVAGDVAKGLGTAAMAGAAVASDERAKQDAYEMGKRDQDALARQLGGQAEALNAPVLAELAGGTPEQDAEANRLARQIGLAQEPKLAQLGKGGAETDPFAGLAKYPSKAFDPTRPVSEQPNSYIGWERGPQGEVLDRTARNMDLNAFRYKPGVAGTPSAPAGQRVGVMAQDLERDPLARQVVQGGGDRMKSLDVPNAVGLSLGLHGRSAERLDALERRVGRR